MALSRMTSLDPAMAVSVGGRDFEFCHNVHIVPDEIYAFDFDGVISSNFEDQIYKVEPTAEDIKLTSAAAQLLGIRCDGMELRYQRHLVYQAALWRLNRPIAPGPVFEEAKKAADVAKLFVLTARSGWFAVERCRDFFKYHNILPVETYHVGRVGKAAQIKLLCDQFPEQTVNFVEDSREHLRMAVEFNPGKFRPILIPSDREEQFDSGFFMRHYVDTLEAVYDKMRNEFGTQMEHI